MRPTRAQSPRYGEQGTIELVSVVRYYTFQSMETLLHGADASPA